jgi:hypothetical protein
MSSVFYGTLVHEFGKRKITVRTRDKKSLVTVVIASCEGRGTVVIRMHLTPNIKALYAKQYFVYRESGQRTKFSAFGLAVGKEVAARLGYLFYIHNNDARAITAETRLTMNSVCVEFSGL